MDDVKLLLQRRKEIRAQINKLEAECQAIEHVVLRLHGYEHPTRNWYRHGNTTITKIKRRRRPFNWKTRER